MRVESTNGFKCPTCFKKAVDIRSQTCILKSLGQPWTKTRPVSSFSARYSGWVWSCWLIIHLTEATRHTNELANTRILQFTRLQKVLYPTSHQTISFWDGGPSYMGEVGERRVEKGFGLPSCYKYHWCYTAEFQWREGTRANWERGFNYCLYFRIQSALTFSKTDLDGWTSKGISGSGVKIPQELACFSSATTGSNSA